MRGVFMVIEIIITAVIVVSAVVLFTKSMKKKASGGCDCGHCSASCSVKKIKNK
jgi:heterodisulfide reductase subunit C